MNNVDWFIHDRFGIFIHFGIYSIPARGEWIRSIEKISNEEYDQYFQEFNPVRYNPRNLAKIAKNAGQRYAIMTAKHHDGFCLFDSMFADYTSTRTPLERDLISEFVSAFREEGLKVGFYYSLLDWHHSQYPIDRFHPLREKSECRGKERDFSRYIEYFHGQVRELLTRYGKIDIMWFDFSYDHLAGEAWKAGDLVSMVRSLQPGIIINNRLGGDPRKKNPPSYVGDFITPEQIIPPDFVIGEDGRLVPWEACVTMNDHWGYCAMDTNYKSPKQLIQALVECVSKGGNLLLNVGPDAKGIIPKESVKILARIAEWMKDNSDSIYGCGPSDFPKPEWGRYTQKGNRLYAHVINKSIGPINLRGLAGKIKKARLLRDGSELQILRPWNAEDYPEDAFVEITGVTLPDTTDTVVELELA